MAKREAKVDVHANLRNDIKKRKRGSSAPALETYDQILNTSIRAPHDLGCFSRLDLGNVLRVNGFGIPRHFKKEDLTSHILRLIHYLHRPRFCSCTTASPSLIRPVELMDSEIEEDMMTLEWHDVTCSEISLHSIYDSAETCSYRKMDKDKQKYSSDNGSGISHDMLGKTRSFLENTDEDVISHVLGSPTLNGPNQSAITSTYNAAVAESSLPVDSTFVWDLCQDSNESDNLQNLRPPSCAARGNTSAETFRYQSEENDIALVEKYAVQPLRSEFAQAKEHEATSSRQEHPVMTKMSKSFPNVRVDGRSLKAQECHAVLPCLVNFHGSEGGFLGLLAQVSRGILPQSANAYHPPLM